MTIIRNLIAALTGRQKVGPRLPRGLEVQTLPMIAPYPGPDASES